MTATLAVTAHSFGGGGMPSSATAALLSLMAVTLGALVASLPQARDGRVLLAVLSVGQLLGHLMLGAAGHSHLPTSAKMEAVMLVAHLVAVAAGAILITVGGRLCAAVSRTVLATKPLPNLPVSASSTPVVDSADQPLQSATTLAASVSRRGPPVSFAP